MAATPRSRPTGFRLAVRQALYLRERNGLGCDREDCSCRKHLRMPDLDAEPMDSRWLPRLRHIVRIESLIAVGCKFAPNDLDWGQWKDLQALVSERQWMDGQVREARERIREEGADAQKGMAEVRQAAGIPGPGQSLFGGKPAGAKRRR